MFIKLSKQTGILFEKFFINLKWMIFGVICGALIGTVAALFGKAISYVTALRTAHPAILFGLPLAGVAIVWYYHILGADSPRGTNLVIDSIHNDQKVPFRMTPLIIVSTVVTHLFGGSAGREGAALQVGGSLGDALGRLLIGFNDKDRRRTIMCGMSASFAALFRTPLAASVMPIEMSTVGVMYYSAFMPCVVAALTAHVVAGIINPGSEETMVIANVPEFSFKQGGLTVLFAIFCSLVAVLFCAVLHSTKKLAKLTAKNSYLRAAACGVIVVVLTLIVGSQTYNGAGAAIIEACVLDGAFKIVPYAFLLKMLFTAVTLSGGFQGGEIVPTLFVGATFGHAVAVLFGMSPTMGAALGATFVFCGVTNCPMTSILIGFELFGFELSPFILLGVAITFLFSGNYGLYGSQKIRYSKYDPGRVDINAH